MMTMSWSLTLAAGALAADVLDPDDCTTFPCLIFHDEFDFSDQDVWEHEITLSGGGNWEFQAYVNNRSVSYTRDSTLFIKPQLTSDWRGEAFLTSGELNVWGLNGRGSVCTSNAFYGCNRVGTATNLINPIMSARLRTLSDFAFRYGRIEVRAKMPRGDWSRPAIWMSPQYWPYGEWPASGEIDIVECRGNDRYGSINNQMGSSTMHWGPFWTQDFFDMTTTEYTSDFVDSFHVWRIDWTSTNIKFYLDGELKMTVDPGTNFWNFAGLDSTYDNPWVAGDKMAPFDKKFYIVISLAAGGVNGFFPDGIVANKPWENSSPHAPLDFWKGRDSWSPSWEQGEGKISEGAALKVDYVKVWKMESVIQ